MNDANTMNDVTIVLVALPVLVPVLLAVVFAFVRDSARSRVQNQDNTWGEQPRAPKEEDL